MLRHLLQTGSGNVNPCYTSPEVEQILEFDTLVSLVLCRLIVFIWFNVMYAFHLGRGGMSQNKYKLNTKPKQPKRNLIAKSKLYIISHNEIVPIVPTLCVGMQTQMLRLIGTFLLTKS